MNPTLQKILNALEKSGSIPAKEKERLRKELQKTEKTLQKKDTQLSAQARELEIEAALERIRARAMAMHSSEELNDVLSVLFNQFDILGVNPVWAHLSLIDLKNNTFTYRMTGRSGKRSLTKQVIDLNARAEWKESLKNFKKGKPNSVSCVEYRPETLPQIWELFDETLSALPEEGKVYPEDFPDGLFNTQGYCKFGYIGFNHNRKATEEEKAIVARFATEFGRIYQRYLDIEKAEAQAREAQIQLSLERVRARSMAMHSSEELNDVLSILFQQFDVLGIKPLNVWLSLYNLEENTFTYRATGTGGSRVQGQQVIDLGAMDIWQEQLEQWKSGNAEPVLVTFYPPEVLPQLMEVFKETFDAMPAEERMDPKLFPDGGYNVQGYTKFGYIGYNHLQAPTQEEKDILLKFATEFERVYQRFLEIKKAEGQAREAQIEASLERVRSASMAIHKSEELHKVVLTVSQEINSLGLHIDAAHLFRFEEGNDKGLNMWIAGDGYIYPHEVYFPYLKHEIYDGIYNARTTNKDFFAISGVSKKEKDRIYRHLLKNTKIKIPESRQKFSLKAKSIAYSVALAKHSGMALVRFSEEGTGFSIEENEILKRFSNVFEQAFIRFLGLAKAESQAREAQIEGALERVRTRTMAMHNTDDIAATVTTFFNELLGLHPDSSIRCGIGILSQSEHMELWTASVKNSSKTVLNAGTLDMSIHPLLKGVKKNWSKKEKSFSYILKGKDVKAYFRILNEAPDYPAQFDLNTIPKIVYHNSFVFRDGVLFVFTGDPLQDDIRSILERFTAVFGQTYTRYLDLHKAEAQAREAQIEAALERVRSRSMAMQGSSEMLDVIAVVSEQLQELKLNFDTVSFAKNKQEGDFTFWITSRGQSKPILMEVPTLDSPVLKGVYKAQKKKITFLADVFTAKENREWHEHLIKYSDLKYFPEPVKKYILNAPGFARSSFLLKNIDLYVGNYRAIPFTEEENSIFKRFAQVFEQAYTRFLDLQNVEAQARESQIQLSLERVRARSLAMQSTDELHEVLGVLFRQFDDLGIQPVNVFLSLFDREQRTLTYRASGKSGKRIPGKQVVEVDSMEALQALYDKWLTDNSDTVEVIYYPREVLPQLFGIFSDTFSSMPKAARIGVKDFPDGGYSMAGYTPYGYLGYDHQRQATEEEKDILTRFCVEFTRVYQRFLDIQKAEAQTREAQIEMALERVRSASLAMHQSKDLHNVLVMLYNQLDALGLKMHSAQILESIDDFKEMHCWIVTNGVVYPEQVHAPFSKNIFFKRLREAVTNGESFYTLKFSKRQKDNLFHHFFDNTILRNAPQARKDLIFSSPGLGTSNAIGKYTSLSIMRYDGILYSDEENEIIKRFAKVLEQSYTRFLDIQKAETQAREAQIEAAQEKVRSQSLAMHATSEMQQVANAVYDQLKELGLEMDAVGMSGAISAKQDYDVWVGGVPFGKALRIPYNENTKVQRDYNKMLEERPELFAKTYSGKDKEEYINHLLTHGDFPKALKKKMKTSETFSTSIALAKKSSIQILRYTDQPYSEEDNEILKRFSKVFEQAYIRFMDLEKAEAQARESQIEAALEKVRSRSLAMQKPEELQEVVAVVGEKLQELGVILDSGGVVICTYFPDSKDVMHWTVTFDPAHPSVPYYLPYFDTPIWKETWASKWESDDDFFEKIFSFKDKNHFFHKAFEISDYKNLPEEHKKEILSVKTHALSFAWQTNSALMIPSHTGKLLPEEHKTILKRFSRVFEQAYIRFMDLQKAEAQARESKIEIALERVRSRTMAMHKSEELGEVAAVLFEQISTLTYAPERFNIAIGNKEEESFDIWVTDQKGHEVSKRFMFQADKSPVVREVFNAWEKEPYIVQDLHGKKLQEWVRYMQEEIGLPFDDARLSEHRYINSVFFSHGCIGITTNEPPEAEVLELISRFTKVFQQTYVRFLDLQKAEAQARESQIEVALERVRSRAMAMHHSDELTDVLGVLFNQFDFLGINPVLTHLTLFDEDNETFTLRITTGGEKRTIAEQLIDVNAVESWKTSFANWKKSELHAVDCIDYPPEVLPAVWEVLDGVMSALPEGQKLFPEDFPNGLYTTQGHCKYGYIGFNHSRRATEEEKEIVVRFAKEFGRLYQRFLDIQKAESQAREAQIEGALERVRSKAMAMHSSDDLADTVEILYKELDTLQAHALRFGHAKVNSDTKIVELHTATDLGKVVGQLKLEGHPLLEKIYEHFLAKEDLYYALQGEEMKSYYSILGRAIDVPIPPMDTVQHGYFFILGDTANYAWSDKALDEEELKVYKRLISVLNLTYKRYEELKNAETQAREAQIEGALERVRSKTMAMHNSEDLEEIVLSLFDEVLKLGIDKSIRCGIGILEGHEGMETKSVNSNADGTVELRVGMLNMTIHPMLANLKKAWKNGRKGYSYEFKETDVRKYYTALNNEPEYPFNADLKSLPKQEYHRSFFFSSGIIFAFSENPISEESSKILARFAVVFGQTYQRFLDLQKAEERAKDAVKQASLDRVRGQIASMRSAEDLERITPLVWNELTTLDIPFIRCGVFIIDDPSEKVQVHLSAPDGHSLGVMQMPFDADPLTSNMVENWRKGEVFKAHWNKEQFSAFMQTMIDLGQINNKKVYQGAEQPPESLHLHFVPFTQGMLYVGNVEPLVEEQIELVQSLADAFAIAYARYEDFSKLEKAKERVETTLSELKATQNQLVQSEKMASLGELTAGIAHEIQNPLNFVNNFSEVSVELIEEMLEEIQKGDVEEVKALADDIIQNLQKINHHGKRADGIVKGMLQHSRASSGEKEPTDINVLADEYLRLAYHGLRAKDKSFNATLETHFDESLGKVNILTQDMGRVILNLITNAFYAVQEKKGQNPEGYEPTVTVSTKKTKDGVLISVKDNGNGIPEGIKEKIFQPFFTTKPTGQGTGLGLSMSYDIITKGHGGEITIETIEYEGSSFNIYLPL